MVQTLSEILFANLDVSTHVLGWLVIFLAKDTGVQTHLRREITDSSGRLVEFCGRKDTLLHLCFLESVRLRPFTGMSFHLPRPLLENNRSLNFKVFTVPESSPQTKVLGGHTIPPNVKYFEFGSTESF
jgi:hypothetical protein